MLDPADATHAYLTGQLHPSQAGLLKALAAEGSAAVAAQAPHLDLAEAWIAPAALVLVAGSAAALSVLLRRKRA